MQEPTTHRRHASAARRLNPLANRASSSTGFKAGRLIIASALTAGILSLPLLGLAAEKKSRSVAAHSTSQSQTPGPVSSQKSGNGASTQIAGGAPVFPGVPVTASAQKTADKAQPGQIIPVPASQSKATTIPLAKVLSGNTATPAPAAPSNTKTASTATPSVFTVKETRTQVIKPRSVIQMSHDVEPGHTKLAHEGSEGVLVKTFNVTYKDGKPIRYQLISQKMVKVAMNRVLLAGIRTREARALPSRSGVYARVRELDMVATGYSPYEGSGSGRCATGIRAGYGVVAVDPRVIPLGSRLYIEGYGYAIAGDTGGAIRHNRIDLGMNSYRQANHVGRRRVHVYVLSEMR
ncbi:MAG TPA: 3D domain-containing protein [Capsulimonadaceae bacterium]|nr:3D domain-containing protein [Capsulimonadaceae bacterium]